MLSERRELPRIFSLGTHPMSTDLIARVKFTAMRLEDPVRTAALGTECICSARVLMQELVRLEEHQSLAAGKHGRDSKKWNDAALNIAMRLANLTLLWQEKVKQKYIRLWRYSWNL